MAEGDRPSTYEVSKTWPGTSPAPRRAPPPVAAAYVPHCAFLLVARKLEPTPDFRHAVCRDQDWLARLAQLHAAAKADPDARQERAPLPWLARPARPARWWQPGEDPVRIRAMALRGDDLDQPHAPDLDPDAPLAPDPRFLALYPPFDPPAPAPDADLPPATPDASEYGYGAVDTSRLYLPLVRVTLATRPLATVFERLSLGLLRGAPFQSVIDVADRKLPTRLLARTLALRVQRVLELLADLVIRLRGWHGGLPGLRVDAADPGRGAYPDGRAALADPLPPHIQRVVVRFAVWHPRAKDWAQSVNDLAAQYDCPDLHVLFMDEYGYDVGPDGVRLPDQPSPPPSKRKTRAL